MVTAALRRRSEHPALHGDVLDPVGDYHLEALTSLWHRHWSRPPGSITAPPPAQQLVRPVDFPSSLADEQRTADMGALIPDFGMLPSSASIVGCMCCAALPTLPRLPSWVTPLLKV